MRKLSVCILFGGVSPEHEVSLRSAESVLNNIDQEKYNVFPVGITRSGEWILFGGRDYSMLPSGAWETCELNRKAALSPVRGQGLLSFENDCVVRERIDVVFPLIHGENGEDGSLQGLLQIAGLPFVGSGVAASSACMDKSITKLLIRQAGVRQGVQCEKGAQQFLGVAEQIGPLACRARVRPCRMGHITGDDRDIPRVKILNMAGKIYLTAVTFAKADLQTVVEVQHPAGDIRDTPVLTCDDAHREM